MSIIRARAAPSCLKLQNVLKSGRHVLSDPLFTDLERLNLEVSDASHSDETKSACCPSAIRSVIYNDQFGIASSSFIIMFGRGG